MNRRLLLPAAVVALSSALVACQKSEPVSLEAETDSYRVEVDLDGTSLGKRTATIEVLDAERRPVAAEQIVVSAVMNEMDMSGPTVIATEIGAGRYEVGGELFTMLGEWTLNVRVEGEGGAAAEQAQFTVEAVP
jgi:YtkA-like protein